ncbi:hypothetical protein ZHAS_00020645 [Anopheles sinensis]|uniref:Uncharacterized protein n=1 Tax=Anopheles sinensis TaxID=74873 RepID=A0A084WQA6_ANOSI|nr:hypothetical protein ZHAS_00020645 [Anopheles sinensis]
MSNSSSGTLRSLGRGNCAYAPDPIIPIAQSGQFEATATPGIRCGKDHPDSCTDIYQRQMDRTTYRTVSLSISVPGESVQVNSKLLIVCRAMQHHRSTEMATTTTTLSTTDRLANNRTKPAQNLQWNLLREQKIKFKSPIATNEAFNAIMPWQNHWQP